MSKVREVIVTIKPRKGSFPGQVAYGWYTLQDDSRYANRPRGKSSRRGNWKKFTHKLAPGEDERAVACKLTKELRLLLRGNSAPVAGFEGPINYPKLKY